MSREAEDTSGGGKHIGRRRTHLEAEDVLEGGRHVGSRSRVQDGNTWHKGVPLTMVLQLPPLSRTILLSRRHGLP